MSVVTVSPKFQIVIPKDVRESLGLRPGDRMRVFVHDGRVELVPQEPMSALRGLLPGLDTDVPREDDRA